MNALQLLSLGSYKLKKKNIPSYRLDSELLLSKTLKKKREKLFICEFHCNFKGTYRDVLKHENDKHPNEIIKKTMNDMILKVIKMNKGKKRKTSKSIKALRKRRLYQKV